MPIGGEKEEKGFQHKEEKGKKVDRITARKDFQRIYQEGSIVSSRYIAIRYMERCNSITRVGFVAGKRIGRGVRRNRAKRLLREAYRLNKDSIKKGYEIIIIAKQGIEELKLRQVEKIFLESLRKANLLNNE